MVDGYYASVVKILKANGFRYLVNAKGSHEKWTNAKGKVVSVPRNLMSRHTANSILRDAGTSIKL
ncbi:MAG: type II toxin-antitoxin system HicA family toxin [Candidatus Devosia phytovorans]|uniref:Type II toxin-antitoxin system HicA family toxin n=1 Tax=Candidatus Devosia phytovorans TaxID=3121372 RepID=A0AAJ6AZR8_9HYPH|nr:type II toxin-antitoxin system HicA family toxin [Devosia sp.]WEK02768.1 MAG: type II toxin-antitoxin system HicA family toxin [Devosia sp.]